MADAATAEVCRRIHRDYVLLEAHRDCYEQIHRLNEGEADPIRDRMVPRLQAGGVDVTVYAIGGDSIAHSNGMSRPLLATLANIDAFHASVSREGSRARLVRAAADIPTTPDGNVHYILHLEGGSPLEGSLSALRCLYRLGVRSMQLTWNVRNELADGVIDGRTGGGLSEFGVAVVREMNRLGMMVDLAHISESGFWQALEVAEGPVVVTHANSRDVYDHPRNIWDAQARAIADSGGVVGVAVVPKFVHPDEPNVERLVDHIAHFADLIGTERVGTGLDFVASDGPRPGRERTHPGKIRFLEGLVEVDQLSTLTEAMLRRGFTESEVAAILGGNFCRVYREVLAGPAAE